MSNNNGGPAFPVDDTYHPNGHVEYGSTGMTLRDYFAAQALTSIIAINGRNISPQASAKYAYDAADAMLKARGETTKEQGQ